MVSSDTKGRVKGSSITGMILLLLLVVAGLAFQFLPEPPEQHYEGVALEPGVFYASSRLPEPAGLKWLVSTTAGKIDLNSSPAPPLTRDARYVILVHGHEAPEQRVATYFADLAAHLAHTTDRRLVIYDWTSVDPNFDRALQRSESRKQARGLIALNSGVPGRDPAAQWPASSYRVDRMYASSSGAKGLSALIGVLSASGAKSIALAGHSMGCYVIAQTFLAYPDAAARVNEVIMLAPDVKGTLWDEPRLRSPKFAGTRFDIFYSPSDLVLRVLSTTMNFGSRLGATGASGALPLPANVDLHDATPLIPDGAEVHGWYKTAAGAQALDLAGLLK